MGYALGIDVFTVDAEGRIAASRMIKQYLIPEDANRKEIADEDIICYIGMHENTDAHALVLLDRHYTSKFISLNNPEEKENEKIKNILDFPLDEKSMTREEKFSSRVRLVEIKSGKIQLLAPHVRRLGITKETEKEKRKVVINSDTDRFIIWPLHEFEKRFPLLYKQLGLKDDEKQQVP